MKRLLIYLAITLTAIGAFSYWYFRPERVIKRNTLSLLSELTISNDIGRTGRIMKSSAIANYFTSPTTLHSDFDNANGPFGQEEINGACDMITQQASSVEITPHEDMVITIADDTATATLSAEVKAKLGKWIEVVDGTYDITIHWKKTDKGWKINECAWKEIP